MCLIPGSKAGKDEEAALTLAKQYLAGIGEAGVPVTIKECQFCHSEPLVMFSSEQQRQFREQGGFRETVSAQCLITWRAFSASC